MHETFMITYNPPLVDIKFWTCVNLGCAVEIFSGDNGECPVCYLISDWILDDLQYKRRNVRW
jgi:hypothetical protein